MSLRARVALLVAGVVVVVVGLVGWIAVRTADQELTQEVDNDLRERAAVLQGGEGPGGPGGRLRDFAGQGDRRGDRRAPPREDPFGFLVEFDAFARVVNGDGDVLLTLADDLSVPPDAHSLDQAHQHGAVIEGLNTTEGNYRLLTVEATDNLFIQIARPLDEVEQAVDDLQNKVLLFGILAVVVGAGGGWVVAGRTVRPIVRLTDTAEEIAQTGNVELPVEGSGTGEVGRLATSFRTMLGALATSRRQQHQLVMDASHELRTPLTSMRTNVDVLRRAPALSDDDRSAVLDDVDAELGELSDLVAELVDLASDVRGEERVELVELYEIVGPVVARAERRTGRTIDVRIDHNLALEGRPEALTRAVRNLLDNATKFSESGAIELVIDGGSVTVHDSGSGIPEDERTRVFDRFHRLDEARSEPGSGLGLAIVRQVAEAHGGDVFVEESPLGGAAVGFRVPTIDEA